MRILVSTPSLVLENAKWEKRSLTLENVNNVPMELNTCWFNSHLLVIVLFVQKRLPYAMEVV